MIETQRLLKFAKPIYVIDKPYSLDD